MIVKDEESLDSALAMLESQGPVRYSDEYSYIIITTPETLELQCRRAFGRNDVAVVVPRGSESEMEDYAKVRLLIRKQRAEDEKREIKEWVREHPEVVTKIEKSLKKRREVKE